MAQAERKSDREAYERSKLISAVTERVDSNRNGVFEPEEIGQFYSALGRLDYNCLTNKDIRLYLERTDPSQQ